MTAMLKVPTVILLKKITSIGRKRFTQRAGRVLTGQRNTVAQNLPIHSDICLT